MEFKTASAPVSISIVPSSVLSTAVLLSAMNASSHQKQSFLQSWVIPNPSPKPREDSIKKKTTVVDLGGGSEVLYIPRFIPPDKSAEWLRYLDTHIPWTRPSIHVFGRSCLQPRETCYVASKGLPDLKYSGYQPHAYSWDEYPILKDILKEVHETLPGSCFNSLLLNRYKNGGDYVSWHSDDEKIYGPAPQIASLSLGCEREFLLRKRPTKAHTDQTPSKRPAEHLVGKRPLQRVEQHSFMLKHGSLLVMRGYTQREWVHSVPKRAKADAVRINLTFRQVLS